MPTPPNDYRSFIGAAREVMVGAGLTELRTIAFIAPADNQRYPGMGGEAVRVAKAAGARHRVIVGDDLLAENYPTIHAVGRASARAPRLVDIVWGDPAAPKVTLVGKGVCFDTGGLDLKTASGMRLMKKDMAGAAIVLGLAQAIMDAGLPVRLRVLLPCVENAVSGNAMRPLDIVRTRKGLTVEVGNTDAEGRLILCDALAEASNHSRHNECRLWVETRRLRYSPHTAPLAGRRFTFQMKTLQAVARNPTEIGSR